MASFMDRVKSAWNVFTKDPPLDPEQTISSFQASLSSGTTYGYDNVETILAPIVTRIAMDVANLPTHHVLNDVTTGSFKEIKQSELDDRLNIMANIDQTGRAFRQDAVMTMLFQGACAIVPVETNIDPRDNSFEILSARVGEILQWYNQSVQVNVYNEKTGQRTSIVLPKNVVAIPNNPLYKVMNQTNSTLKRLVDKLALLDAADVRLYNSQLDLILQLPFPLRGEKKNELAATRLADIQNQLDSGPLGIAYIDANEKVTQLNRPVTDALMTSVASLDEKLQNQLGLTPAVFNGTATEEEWLAYNNRTVLPIANALIEAMIGTFFTRTAIRQGHSIRVFPSLFKMASLSSMAEAVDKFTRNEILTSNEVRGIFGLRPSNEPDADSLRNKNLNKTDNVLPNELPAEDESSVDEGDTNDKK